MNKYCDFAGIGLITWGPLNAGRLARPLAQDTTRSESTKGTPWAQMTPEWDGEIIDRVEKLAKEKGWKMSRVALAWVNEKIAAPIVGFSSVRSSRCGRDCDTDGHADPTHGGGHHSWVQADGRGGQVAGGAVPAPESPWPPVMASSLNAEMCTITCIL
jgi:hypothetical protein